MHLHAGILSRIGWTSRVWEIQTKQSGLAQSGAAESRGMANHQSEKRAVRSGAVEARRHDAEVAWEWELKDTKGTRQRPQEERGKDGSMRAHRGQRWAQQHFILGGHHTLKC